MSVMFGIEKPRWIESRFQRWRICLGLMNPGALPQARVELRAFGAKHVQETLC
jgi:hypothetical protein